MQFLLAMVLCRNNFGSYSLTPSRHGRKYTLLTRHWDFDNPCCFELLFFFLTRNIQHSPNVQRRPADYFYRGFGARIIWFKSILQSPMIHWYTIPSSYIHKSGNCLLAVKTGSGRIHFHVELVVISSKKYSKNHDQFRNSSVKMKMNMTVSFDDTLISTVCMQTSRLSSSLVEFW